MTLHGETYLFESYHSSAVNRHTLLLRPVPLATIGIKDGEGASILSQLQGNAKPVSSVAIGLEVQIERQNRTILETSPASSFSMVSSSALIPHYSPSQQAEELGSSIVTAFSVSDETSSNSR